MGHFLGSILKAILHSLLSLEQIAGLFPGLGLKGAVHGAAGHCLVEIHEVAVEVGAIHAGELGLAAHGQAAAAAHAGAVDHDGVHGDDALEAVLLAGLDHKLHHDERTDGDDQVVLVAGSHQLVEGSGDDALGAVAAIVGHDPQLVAAGLELVLEDEQVLAAEEVFQSSLVNSPDTIIDFAVCLSGIASIAFSTFPLLPDSGTLFSLSEQPVINNTITKLNNKFFISCNL